MNAQSTALVEFRSRLPMPRELAAKDDIDARKWRVLCETTFPNARTSEAVLMAIDYCRARGLDVFKKPVHIVPMWNSSLQREVETVWPGINEVQITAARTGAWAGMDEPRWGEPQTVPFKGRKKVKGSWVDTQAEVTFPEWCVVTVYRMVGGQPRAFAEPVYWLEAYSRAGGSELPTDMWIKRPRGQLHKVAKAASLRAAFPEEGEYTAEDMEGKEIEAGGVVITAEPVRKSSMAAKRDGDWPKLLVALEDCQSAREVELLRAEYQEKNYPTWNKDWQREADELFNKRLADFSEPEHLPETLADSIALEEEVDTPTSAQVMTFGECVDWLGAAETVHDLEGRAANEGYVEGIKTLTVKQRNDLRRTYKSKLETLRLATMSTLEAG